MNYYYDIILNWGENKAYDFYEWNDYDNLELLKKIPLIKLKHKTFIDLISNKIKVSSDFLDSIHDKTLVSDKKNIKRIEYACLFTDTKNVIALEFNKEGLTMNRSKLLIEDELNVKNVIFTDDVRDFTSYTFKPQLKTVGPKYGKQLGGIKEHLSSLDGNAAMDELKAKGALVFDVAGTEVSLSEEDLLIEMSQKEGYVSEADNYMTVVLDTNLTPELIEEGFVYEVISKIQTMRKDADFEVMDHIRVAINGNERIADIVRRNEEAIAQKVLADEILVDTPLEISREWNVNGENVTIGVAKN